MVASSYDKQTLDKMLVPSVSMPTMMGIAIGVVGNKWSFVYSQNTILGNVLNGDPFRFQKPVTDQSKIDIIVDNLKLDLAYVLLFTSLISPLIYWP